MIKIAGMWFKAEDIIAILPHYAPGRAIKISGKCEIYFGPKENDSFVVPIDPDEAAKMVNDDLGWKPDEQAIQDARYEEFACRMASNT